MNRPLIAHVVFRLGIGGLENGLVNLVNGTGGDFRHAIICLTTSGEIAARICSPGVEVFELQKRPGKDLRMYWRLWVLLRRLRPTIVHSRNFGTLDCQLIAALAGVPVRVHGEHGWDVDDLDGTSRRRILIRRASRLFVHRYVAVSEHMRNWLVRDVRLPVKQVTRISNGVDAGAFVKPAGQTRAELLPFDPMQGRLTFGFVGRLEAVKDLPTLIEAFRLLRSGDDEWRQKVFLVIAGDGSLRSILDDLALRAGLGSSCWFAGSRSNVADVMQSLDVFVLPSLNEGMSNTVLEAMSSGLPVIATEVGGNPELVDPGVTGILVPPRNAAALAEAMASYAAHPDLARQHGSAGRSRVYESLGLQKMIDAYRQLYLQALPKGKRAPCAA